MIPIDASKKRCAWFSSGISLVDGVIRRSWNCGWVRSSSEEAEPLGNKATNTRNAIIMGRVFMASKNAASRARAQVNTIEAMYAPSTVNWMADGQLAPCHQHYQNNPINQSSIIISLLSHHIILKLSFEIIVVDNNQINNNNTTQNNIYFIFFCNNNQSNQQQQK